MLHLTSNHLQLGNVWDDTLLSIELTLGGWPGEVASRVKVTGLGQG